MNRDLCYLCKENRYHMSLFSAYQIRLPGRHLCVRSGFAFARCQISNSVPPRSKISRSCVKSSSIALGHCEYTLIAMKQPRPFSDIPTGEGTAHAKAVNPRRLVATPYIQSTIEIQQSASHLPANWGNWHTYIPSVQEEEQVAQSFWRQGHTCTCSVLHLVESVASTECWRKWKSRNVPVIMSSQACKRHCNNLRGKKCDGRADTCIYLDLLT